MSSKTESLQNDLPVLLTPNEVAETGIMSEYSVRKGIADGSIPYIKIGNRFHVNFTKLLEMIDGC